MMSTRVKNALDKMSTKLWKVWQAIKRAEDDPQKAYSDEVMAKGIAMSASAEPFIPTLTK